MLNLRLNHTRSFAIDLGNSKTTVADKEHVLLTQPSCIVFDKKNKSVKAVGDKAYDMYEKAHDNLKPVKPMRGGVIADYDSAFQMIHQLVHQVYSKSWYKGFDDIVIGVPYHTTEVERRALRDTMDQFQSKHQYLLYEPLAAALGMGLNIEAPEGKLVLDIGGGITEIVVISLSGIAAFQSLRTAGDSFDIAIQDHFRRNYNMGIGLKTAEQVKIQVGSVVTELNDVPAPMLVRGKDLVTGIPMTRTITHKEVAGVLDKSVSAIELALIQTLETCPPELAGDIYQSGLHVTGGGSMLRGLTERLESRINLKVHIDKDAVHTVSKGLSKALKDPRKYKALLFN